MGNIMWHVALKPGTSTMQDVIVADIEVNDFETIELLLSSRYLKGKVIETEEGTYLLMYGGEYKRPCPSIMIWRVKSIEEGDFITDMREEDARILKHIWREWLMPEETNAEYIPPNQFILMQRQ